MHKPKSDLCTYKLHCWLTAWRIFWHLKTIQWDCILCRRPGNCPNQLGMLFKEMISGPSSSNFVDFLLLFHLNSESQEKKNHNICQNGTWDFYYPQLWHRIDNQLCSGDLKIYLEELALNWQLCYVLLKLHCTSIPYTFKYSKERSISMYFRQKMFLRFGIYRKKNWLCRLCHIWAVDCQSLAWQEQSYFISVKSKIQLWMYLVNTDILQIIFFPKAVFSLLRGTIFYLVKNVTVGTSVC